MWLDTSDWDTSARIKLTQAKLQKLKIWASRWKVLLQQRPGLQWPPPWRDHMRWVTFPWRLLRIPKQPGWEAKEKAARALSEYRREATWAPKGYKQESEMDLHFHHLQTTSVGILVYSLSVLFKQIVTYEHARTSSIKWLPKVTHSLLNIFKSIFFPFTTVQSNV